MHKTTNGAPKSPLGDLGVKQAGKAGKRRRGIRIEALRYE